MHGETVERMSMWFTNRRTKYKKENGQLPPKCAPYSVCSVVPHPPACPYGRTHSARTRVKCHLVRNENDTPLSISHTPSEPPTPWWPNQRELLGAGAPPPPPPSANGNR